MFDQLAFIGVDGQIKEPSITILALSTCGFCKKGMQFLEEKGYAYRYIFVDKIDPEIKAKVKEDFKLKFQSALSYPALILDDGRFTIGFIRKYWEDLLTSEAQPPELETAE